MTVDYGIAKVRPARLEDAAALAPRLRAADLAELSALSTRSPQTTLEHGIKAGTAYAVELATGEVVALFGVAPTGEPKLGAVWMLGSEGLLSIRLTFLRHSRHWLEQLFAGYSLLGNFVDARNTVHVEWLRWLGFRFLRRVHLGKKGEAFYEFVKMKSHEFPSGV